MFLGVVFLILCSTVTTYTQYVPEEIEEFESPQENYPTIFVAILARNKEHILPHVLHYFEHQNYPKHRVQLWIRSDHNIDKTEQVIKTWVSRVSSLYHNIDFIEQESPTGFSDEKNECDWSQERFSHVMKLRQEALNAARRSWADYLLMLDADVLLTNENTIVNLVNQSKPIVAPMLNYTGSEFYCNFWGGINEDGYYHRSENYIDTLHRQRQGCFITALVHTVFLVNLRHEASNNLVYYPSPVGYNGPQDDIIIFTYSAIISGMQIYILNDEIYGFGVVPLDGISSLENEMDQFIHMKLENIIYGEMIVNLPVSPLPEKSKLGYDEIYMINLARRPDRRIKMMAIFDELGINATVVDAVDGRDLNQTYLDSLGIKMLPGYEDPHNPRPLTMGEIGCFLSHYHIWEDIVKRNLERVIVFEDDLRFQAFFKHSLNYAMAETEHFGIEWDLMYLGRKIMDVDDEVLIDGTELLAYPSYSYWTLSYIININGAKKLLNQQPLGKMIAVDEYIPVMFDKNPVEEWSSAFYPRDLKALSIHPLVIYPTHYTGEDGYITDTEDSETIPVDMELSDDKNTLNEYSNILGHDDHYVQSRPIDEL